MHVDRGFAPRLGPARPARAPKYTVVRVIVRDSRSSEKLPELPLRTETAA